MSRTFGARVWAWGPVALVAGAISFGSSLRHIAGASGTEALGHLAEYAVFAFVIRRALVLEGFPQARAAYLAVALATGFGALDEIHQAFVPFRTPSAIDALTDVAGACFGSAAGQVLAEVRRF